MDLQVHSVHFDADRKLLDFISKKIGKLELYFDNIIAGEVFLRIGNPSDSENEVVEIKLNIPGKELFAKKQCKSFEEATELANKELQRAAAALNQRIMQRFPDAAAEVAARSDIATLEEGDSEFDELFHESLSILTTAQNQLTPSKHKECALSCSCGNKNRERVVYAPVSNPLQLCSIHDYAQNMRENI
jgi:putative sigma-54 modulation protein